MSKPIETRFVDTIDIKGTEAQRVEVIIYGVKKAFKKAGVDRIAYSTNGRNMRVTIEEVK